MDFSEYVAARGEALERYAFVLTGDAHRAQDLTQTALLKAYRRWRRVVRADSPDAYVLVLRHYEGWSDAAIAEVLRCGEPSVRTHASRGLQRLRAALDPATQPGGTR